jgi:hypothetical protein
MMSQADSRFYTGSFDGASGVFHASLFTNATAGSRPSVSGTLTAGTGARHATVGGFTDPLYGVIFQSGGSNGVQLQSASGTQLSWANTSYGNRHTVAFSQRRKDTNHVLAVISQPGAHTQLLVGLQTTASTKNSEFDREAWAGTNGVAAGIHFRSGARFYTEERLGFAGGGLPLIPGDAPTQIDAGYDLTSALGARLGFEAAKGQYGRPFMQLYGHAGSVSGSLTHQAQGNVATVGVNGDTTSGFFNYGRYQGSSFVSASGQAQVRRGLVIADSYSASHGTRDSWAEYLFNRNGPGLTLGVESVATSDASRFGPIIGATAPLTSALVARVEFHPLAHGNGIRFALNQTLTARNRIAPTHFITVGASTEQLSPVYVLIDGIRGPQLAGSTARIPVPDGNHYISLQTQDDQFGSQEARVIDGNPASVTLPLWPVAEIHGRVSLPGDAATVFLGGLPSVANITIIIQPGGLITQTDPSGNFTFAPQPIAPGATVGIDGSALPDGVAPGPLQPAVANQSITLVLKPSKKVEKVTF